MTDLDRDEDVFQNSIIRNKSCKKPLACPYCEAKKIQKNYKIDYKFKMCDKCIKKAEIF